MGASRNRTWPYCTMIRDCDHTIMHASTEAASKFADVHMDELVTRGGQCVCRCHDPALARELGITPFDCDYGTGLPND